MTWKIRNKTCRTLMLLGLLMPVWAQAGSFQVNPVGAELSANRTTGVVTVTNNGTESSVVQLQVVAWSQHQGEDRYVPTRDLLATPPIFTVAPGAPQIVRIGLRVGADARLEKSYRLFFQEVPPPPLPGFRGLQMALRIGIPVFVLPAIKAAPDLHWQIQRLGNRQAKLTVSNTGNAHAHLASFDLNLSGHAQPLAHQEGAYLLPGQSRSWTLEFSSSVPAGAELQVSAFTDQGAVHAQLAFQ